MWCVCPGVELSRCTIICLRVLQVCLQVRGLLRISVPARGGIWDGALGSKVGDRGGQWSFCPQSGIFRDHAAKKSARFLRPFLIQKHLVFFAPTGVIMYLIVNGPAVGLTTNERGNGPADGLTRREIYGPADGLTREDRDDCSAVMD